MRRRTNSYNQKPRHGNKHILMPRSSEEEEEEQEAGFKDNLKTAGGAVAFLVAFIGSGAYFFRSLKETVFFLM